MHLVEFVGKPRVAVIGAGERRLFEEIAALRIRDIFAFRHGSFLLFRKFSIAPHRDAFTGVGCTSGRSGGCGPITLVRARQAQISSLHCGTLGAEPPTPTAPMN